MPFFSTNNTHYLNNGIEESIFLLNSGQKKYNVWRAG
jgi:hypothetical protein